MGLLRSPAADPAAAPRSRIEQLAARQRRLAQVVDATARRRDVRERRASILLLLLEFHCPRDGRPARREYVPGAVVRLGAEGLRRAWPGYFGEAPPSLRAMRSHLGELERACALVRSPGDWMPVRRDHERPERRPRYPQTLHLLLDDAEADWWAGEGAALLEQHPDARANPTAWRALYRGWRHKAAARQVQPMLPFDAPTTEHGRPVAVSEPVAASSVGPVSPYPSCEGGGPTSPTARARALVGAAREASAVDVLRRVAESGLRIRSRVTWQFAADPERLRGALLLLARSYLRGDRVRSAERWLSWAFHHAPPADLAAARRWASGDPPTRSSRTSSASARGTSSARTGSP